MTSKLSSKAIFALQQQGITVTQDGDSIIYQDRVGTKIIDFTSGLGPIGTNLGLLADMNNTAKSIKTLIRVSVSDNQFLALTSFALHVGLTNFAGSNVLSRLNEGHYEEVPSLLQAWRMGATSASADVRLRDDYVQRRQFEGELFSTPDWVEFDLTDTQTKTFAQLRHELVVAKQTALSAR